MSAPSLLALRTDVHAWSVAADLLAGRGTGADGAYNVARTRWESARVAFRMACVREAVDAWPHAYAAVTRRFRAEHPTCERATCPHGQRALAVLRAEGIEVFNG